MATKMMTKTVTALHQGKFISDALIERADLMLRIKQFGDPVKLPTGMGDTVEFIGYQRMDVVVDRLQEGVTPEAHTFSLFRQKVQVDQWGMYVVMTDVSELTTDHPILQEAIDLMADSLARTKEYNAADTLLSGTNVLYWDGTRANRGAITATDFWKADIAHWARSSLGGNGAPGRSGELYDAVIDTYVEGDVFADQATTGGYTSTLQAQQGGMAKLEKGFLKDWLGFRWIRCNFMPVFRRLTTFAAPVAAGGGVLTGTVYYKMTRRSLARGFEEDISVEGNVAMGANTRLVFTAPASAGYVYNVYAGTATGDANLFLCAENIRPGVAFNLDGFTTSGRNPPQTPAAGVAVHVILIFGAKGVNTVKFDELSVTGMVSPKGASKSDPLDQRRTVGDKYMDKDAIRDQTRVMRVELASRFG